MLSALHTLHIASRVCFGVLWLLTFPITRSIHVDYAMSTGNQSVSGRSWSGGADGAVVQMGRWCRWNGGADGNTPNGFLIFEKNFTGFVGPPSPSTLCAGPAYPHRSIQPSQPGQPGEPGEPGEPPGARALTLAGALRKWTSTAHSLEAPRLAKLGKIIRRPARQEPLQHAPYSGAPSKGLFPGALSPPVLASTRFGS